MEINNKNIGEKFYFIYKMYSDNTALVECGTLKSVLPKYNFKDAFGDTFERENNILFSVQTSSNDEVSRVITNTGLVFNKLSDAISYCNACGVNAIFGYSVLLGENI